MAVLPSLLASWPLPHSPIWTREYRWVEVISENGRILYPCLLTLVIVLLLAGIVQGWRSQELRGLETLELKREVLLALRNQKHGSTIDDLTNKLQIDSFKLLRLMEQMQRDGVIYSFTSSDRLTIWCVQQSPVKPAPTRQRQQA